LGLASAPAVSSLIDIFIKKSEDQALRLAVGSALMRARSSEQAVPAFMVVLKDRKEPAELREAAFAGYWKLASNSVAFSSDFIKVLQDTAELPAMRDKAGQALQRAAVRSAEEVLSRYDASLREVEARLAKARDVRTAFEIGGREVPAELARVLALLEQRKGSIAARRSLARWLLSSPWSWILLPLFPPLICGPIWLLLLWQAPLRLWRISRHLERLPDWKSKAGISVKSQLRSYLLISIFEHHPRVLDAWLEQHWPNAERAFNALGIVSDRSLHIPIPARLGDGAVIRPTPADFRNRLAASRTILTICGEPACGKTSLACQLARWAMAEKPEDRIVKHRMLPLLISREQDLHHDGNGMALVAVVSAKVRALCGDPAELSPEFLDCLLKEQRILVVVDGLSEMSDAASVCLEPVLEGRSSIRSLIVTSRVKDWLPGAASAAVIETPALPSEVLSEFLGAFLTLRGKRRLFADREILDGCARLLDALEGRRPSVFEARMFAELLIGAKESGCAFAAPAHPLDLIRRYLEELNRRVTSEERLDPALILRLAKAAAWACLQRNFWPAAEERTEMLTTSGRQGGDESHLRYLQDKVPLLCLVDGESSRLRFDLAVLAEHLAAWHAIDVFGGDEPAWSRFLEDTALRAKSPKARPFILRLRDVCLLQGEQVGVPETAEIELGKLAGLDPLALEQARVQRKLGRLIEQLSHPETAIKKAAVAKVAELGAAAVATLPALRTIFQNPLESPEVHEAVVTALGGIGGETDEVIRLLLSALQGGEPSLQVAAARTLPRLGQEALEALIKALNDRTVSEAFRVRVLVSLAAFERDRPAAIAAVIQILRDRHQGERVRVAAVETLGRIGSPAEMAAPDLIESMKENKTLCQAAAQALLEIAPDARPAILALVEALNPTHAPSPREILATFRRTLVQTARLGPSSGSDAASGQVHRLLKDALANLRARPHAVAYAESNLAIPMAN
jgi:hypothetical protein